MGSWVQKCQSTVPWPFHWRLVGHPDVEHVTDRAAHVMATRRKQLRKAEVETDKLTQILISAGACS